MTSSSSRLVSLDVFRGLAIASMILVNTPGSWSHVYPPLLHAEWHGFTPTDLVFPAFLFIAGAAMAFSLGKYHTDTAIDTALYLRILRRCALLFALGLFLNSFGFIWKHWPSPDFRDLRILGVLQRISLAYLGGSLLALNLKRRGLWIATGGILLLYWLILMAVPVPGVGVGSLTPEGNVAGYVDRLILGASHLYTPTFDPEGLLSTLPSIATVLLGYFTGDWLRDQPRTSRTSGGLVMFGLAAVILGALWGLALPINKQLWTSSYVLYSGGWSLLLLAACYELIEVRNIRRWSFPLQVMGMNAIFVFVASGIVVRILYYTQVGSGAEAPSTYRWLYETLFVPWAGALNGSLLFAIANILIWYVVLYGLYRKGWFLKL
jgi:predicted acyltransferase